MVASNERDGFEASGESIQTDLCWHTIITTLLR